MTKVHPEFKIMAGHQIFDPWSTKYDLFEFDLPDHLSAVRVLQFLNGWADMLGDCEFGTPGNRNNHAVNLCCLLHVAGVTDIIDWFDKLDDIINLSARDYRKMQEHIERVIPYLEKWGPEGKEEQALCFMV